VSVRDAGYTAHGVSPEWWVRQSWEGLLCSSEVLGGLGQMHMLLTAHSLGHSSASWLTWGTRKRDEVLSTSTESRYHY
jgi:hypothetical protein